MDNYPDILPKYSFTSDSIETGKEFSMTSASDEYYKSLPKIKKGQRFCPSNCYTRWNFVKMIHELAKENNGIFDYMCLNKLRASITPSYLEDNILYYFEPETGCITIDVWLYLRSLELQKNMLYGENNQRFNPIHKKLEDKCLEEIRIEETLTFPRHIKKLEKQIPHVKNKVSLNHLSKSRKRFHKRILSA